MREPVTAVLTRPERSVPAAAAILHDHWAIEGALEPLPSERDRNFVVRVDGEPRWVLKLSNLTDDPAFLELQALAQERLTDAGIRCPRIRAARDGRLVIGTGEDGNAPLARLFSWVPGVPLATVAPAERRPELLHDLGRVMGAVASALRDLDHPVAHRDFQWDVLRGRAVIGAHAEAVVEPRRRALLARIRERLDGSLWPHLPRLLRSLIHNDANDHNVLVDAEAQRVTGILDFGDMVHTATTNELAVACAYAMLGANDPLGVAWTITTGFRERWPLRDGELALVSELIVARLATSVSLSAHQAALDPTDAYLTVSEAPAWDLLADLIEVPPADAARRLGSPS